MKATLRKNKKMMISIKIIQHIGLEDIKEAILSEQGFNKYNSFKPFKKFKRRKEVMELVKKHLGLYGCEIDYSIDDYIRDEFEDKSLDNALKLFPELEKECEVKR